MTAEHASRDLPDIPPNGGRHPEPATDPGAERDLEYDLAHEAENVTVPPRAPEPECVATETEGYDGDYAYDLAHDVPRG